MIAQQYEEQYPVHKDSSFHWARTTEMEMPAKESWQDLRPEGSKAKEKPIWGLAYTFKMEPVSK